MTVRMKRGLAERTRKVYSERWADLEEWCIREDIAGGEAVEISDQELDQYIDHADMIGRSTSYLIQSVAAASAVAVASGRDGRFESARAAVVEIKKRRADDDSTIAGYPLMPDEVMDIIVKTSNRCNRGKRDRAMLAVGYCFALRASEIVAARRKNVSIETGKCRLALHRSKGNQLGRREDMIQSLDSYIPMRVNLEIILREWLTVLDVHLSRFQDGKHLFPPIDRYDNIHAERAMNANSYSMVFGRICSDADFKRPGLSPHSLRAGYITASRMIGTPLEEIMKISRHKSLETLLRYVRMDAVADRNRL